MPVASKSTADTPQPQTSAQPAAAPAPKRIAASPACPEPLPPCAGAWVRAADGALVPQDPATAAAAGLTWDAADAAAALIPQE